jgi:DNA-directed RNA polymerase specialized sigma subunit
MQSLDIIRQARQDIEKLKASSKENNELIAEKEMVIHEQKDFLKSLPTDSLIYKRFTIQGKEPTTEEWHQIEEMVFELFPKFQKFIKNYDGLMNDKERKACILIRAGFKPKNISNMLGVGPSYISNIRTEMLQRIFGKAGSPKEFDRIIRSFC